MPELPEVESVVRALREALQPYKVLSSLEIFCPKISNSLARHLVGKKLSEIQRRGKYIHFIFSEKLSLIIHLRMTGQFLLQEPNQPRSKHERILFHFEGGLQMSFHDTRRFATFDLTKDPKKIFSRLGPEPLDPSFSAQEFSHCLSQRSNAIKACLLDQSIIVGIGNIYADEALWEAKIHPQKLSSGLNKDECDRLFEAIRKVLLKGIENGGTSLGQGTPNFHHLNGRSGENQNTLRAYGQEDKLCSRCHHAIKKMTFQQRGTHFCPHCQKL